MWCPKCKYEFREGFVVCSDCGSTLVEQLTQEEQPEEQAEKPQLFGVEEDQPELEEPTFLIEAVNTIEADMIDAVLEEAGIPRNTQPVNMRPSYDHSHVIYDLQFFVSAAQYDEAVALLQEDKERRQAELDWE